MKSNSRHHRARSEEASEADVVDEEAAAVETALVEDVEVNVVNVADVAVVLPLEAHAAAAQLPEAPRSTLTTIRLSQAWRKRLFAYTSRQASKLYASPKSNKGSGMILGFL